MQNIANVQVSNESQLLEKFTPLIIKITKQFSSKINMSWDEIYCMAMEGALFGIREYDPKKSKMSLFSYVGFAIRNNIYNEVTKTSHTVRMSAYMFDKANKEGKSTFTSISMTAVCGETGGEDSYSREGRYGLYENEHYDGQNPMDLLYEFAEKKLSERERNILYGYFGLKDDEIKLKDLAKANGITIGRASQILSGVIKKIRNNNVLVDALSQIND